MEPSSPKTVTFSQASRNLNWVLDLADALESVYIERRNGQRFVISPLEGPGAQKGTSPVETGHSDQQALGIDSEAGASAADEG